eukprot:3425064-Amphidinium_carterae.1
MVGLFLPSDFPLKPGSKASIAQEPIQLSLTSGASPPLPSTETEEAAPMKDVVWQARQGQLGAYHAQRASYLQQ